MGELLLSLSYLPTAERLTVVVLKAKELVMTAAGGSCGEGQMKLLPVDDSLFHTSVQKIVFESILSYNL